MWLQRCKILQNHEWIIEQFSTIFNQALLETVSALQMVLNQCFSQTNLLFRHGVQIKDKQIAPQWHISCNCQVLLRFHWRLNIYLAWHDMGLCVIQPKAPLEYLAELQILQWFTVIWKYLGAANQCNVCKSNHCHIHSFSLVHLWIDFRVIFSLDDIWTEIVWWRRPKPFMINIWKITFIA